MKIGIYGILDTTHDNSRTYNAFGKKLNVKDTIRYSLVLTHFATINIIDIRYISCR